MDLMSSLAEPGPGTERAADRVLEEEQLTLIHLGLDRALFCMQPLRAVRGGLLQGTGNGQCWDGVAGWRQAAHEVGEEEAGQHLGAANSSLSTGRGSSCKADPRRA